MVGRALRTEPCLATVAGTVVVATEAYAQPTALAITSGRKSGGSHLSTTNLANSKLLRIALRPELLVVRLVVETPEQPYIDLAARPPIGSPRRW